MVHFNISGAAFHRSRAGKVASASHVGCASGAGPPAENEAPPVEVQSGLGQRGCLGILILGGGGVIHELFEFQGLGFHRAHAGLALSFTLVLIATSVVIPEANAVLLVLGGLHAARGQAFHMTLSRLDILVAVEGGATIPRIILVGLNFVTGTVELSCRAVSS